MTKQGEKAKAAPQLSSKPEVNNSPVTEVSSVQKTLAKPVVKAAAVIKRVVAPIIERRRPIKRSSRVNQFAFMKAPGIEHAFEVGDTVEVFCDHEKNRERIRG